MSEAVDGVPVPEIAPILPAAVAILWRPGPKGVEVCWLLRSKALRFAGGFHAFPGGKVDVADAEVAVEGASGDAALYRAAAARELFEEVGVLVARGEGMPDADQRRALLDGRLDFGALLAQHRRTLVASDWQEAGRWITPPSLPRRFDTHFFLVRLPDDQVLDPWVGELAEGGWIPVGEALERWEAGALLLHPPQLHVLRVLASEGTGPAACAALCATPGNGDGIPEGTEFQRAFRAVPLRTATLAPATHTNCYLLGEGDLLIVDPGTADPEELARLEVQRARLEASGSRPLAIVLTHHHGDHSAGARVLAERWGLPIWCHAWTAETLGLKGARHLVEGEVLSLGEGGPFPTRWEVLHTPGHAPGHLCLREASLGAAIVGDMVAGLGTILIDPPEGDMARYLRELRRLRELEGLRTLHPAHGAPLPSARESLTALIDHRLQREARVRAALGHLARSLAEISRVAYADSPGAHPYLAERSTLAHLLKLETDGSARQVEDGWRLP